MKKGKIDIPFRQEIAEACQVIVDGGCLLYPSDSLWGLGCDASNKAAIDKLHALKKRPLGKSMIVLVSSERMLQQVVHEVPAIAWDILDHSTEPLSIIYSEASNSYRHLSPEDGSIAVRLIKTGFAHNLIEYCKKPLISTSANISGEQAALQFDDIAQNLLDSVDYCLPFESGIEMTGKASKLMAINEDGRVKIYR